MIVGHILMGLFIEVGLDKLYIFLILTAIVIIGPSMTFWLREPEKPDVETLPLIRY